MQAVNRCSFLGSSDVHELNLSCDIGEGKRSSMYVSVVSSTHEVRVCGLPVVFRFPFALLRHVR